MADLISPSAADALAAVEAAVWRDIDGQPLLATACRTPMVKAVVDCVVPLSASRALEVMGGPAMVRAIDSAVDQHLTARLAAADALAEAVDDLLLKPDLGIQRWDAVETALAAYRLATEKSRG